MYVADSLAYAAAMSSPDVLSIDRLSDGLFVEYLGETTADDLVVGVGDPTPVCDRLWHGHPGVIWEPTPQHVQMVAGRRIYRRSARNSWLERIRRYRSFALRPSEHASGAAWSRSG